MQRSAAAASTPSGAPPDAQIDVDAGLVRIGRPDDPGDVAVRNELHCGARPTHAGDQLGVPRPVENACRDLRHRHALGFRQSDDVVAGRRVEIDEARRVAGADGDFVHVHVGRVQQAAALRNSEHGERVRHRLGTDGRALERIDGDVDLGSLARADLLADVEHRRLVHLAFADDDSAANGELQELTAHGIDRRLVRRLFSSAPAQACRRDRCRLGHARHLEDKHAVET